MKQKSKKIADALLKFETAMAELQKISIGIIKVHDSIEIVISEENLSFETICFDNVGVISYHVRAKAKHDIEYTPLGTLNKRISIFELLEDPRKFKNWITSYLQNEKDI